MRSRRGLYAILDPDFCAGRDPLLVADAILEGGCAVLQLRHKQVSALQLEPLARALRERTALANVPFVINDHYELAAAVGADGVHVGQTDAPLRVVREHVGPGFFIGVSTHDFTQAARAAAEGADLIGFGPVFATATKDAPDPVVGLDALQEVCSRISVPVVAIGGITTENASAVARHGAAMGAAIAALCGSPDPRSAATRLHGLLRQRSH